MGKWTLQFALLVVAVEAAAAEFQIEVGMDYLTESTESSAPLFMGFAPTPGPAGSISFDSDTDSTSVFASWYLQPVSDDKGPRSRAAFVSRASFVSLSWQKSETSTRIDVDQPASAPPPGVGLPPPGAIPILVDALPKSEVEDVSVSGRYVWQDSGWYVLGNIGLGSLSLTGLPNGEVDTNVLTIGAGFYVGELTTLDVTVIRSEFDGFLNVSSGVSSTDVAMNVSHLGEFRSDWQFGFDAGLLFADEGDDRLRLRGALYPSRNISFGLAIDSRTDDFLGDGSRYSIFGSWFVTPGVELSARLGRVELPGGIPGDGDGELLGLGVLGRF